MIKGQIWHTHKRESQWGNFQTRLKRAMDGSGMAKAKWTYRKSAETEDGREGCQAGKFRFYPGYAIGSCRRRVGKTEFVFQRKFLW